MRIYSDQQFCIISNGRYRPQATYRQASHDPQLRGAFGREVSPKLMGFLLRIRRKIKSRTYGKGRPAR